MRLKPDTAGVCVGDAVVIGDVGARWLSAF